MKKSKRRKRNTLKSDAAIERRPEPFGVCHWLCQ
jgi:hypothetical protein